MKTRRGSSFWPTCLSGASMVNQYKPGDIVCSALTSEANFIGVVRAVDAKINKVLVAWSGGALSQHDPDEIHFDTYQNEIVRSRMAGEAEEGAADKLETYTAAIAKELMKQRKKLQIENIRQNYKGTGSKRGNRQLWVRLPIGAVDVWLESDSYAVGGVTQIRLPGRFKYEGKAPAEVAKDIADKLEQLTKRQQTASDSSSFVSRREMIAADISQEVLSEVSNPADSEIQTDFASPDMENILNEQVGNELYSAYLYFMASAWFQSKGLVGFQAWMERQGHDEIQHAMKVFNYLVDTGSELSLPSIPAPIAIWDNVQQVTRAVLDHEMAVTKQWKRIHELAQGEENPAALPMAHWFLTEQVEEEDGALTLHQKVMMAENGTGVLIIDTDLKDRDPGEATKIASDDSTGVHASIASLYKREASAAFSKAAADPQFVGNPKAHGLETPISGGFGVMQELAKKQHGESVKESKDGEPRTAMVSRRAMYWSNPNRVYRMTQKEVVDDSAFCPKCKEMMDVEPYTKSDKMFRCPSCSFKIPKSNIEVVAGLKSRRG